MNPMMLAVAAVFTTAIGMLRLLGARLPVSVSGGAAARPVGIHDLTQGKRSEAATPGV